MNAYHVPGTALSTVHILTQSILTTAPQGPSRSGFCLTNLIFCSMLFLPRAGARLVSEGTHGKLNKTTYPPALCRLVEPETLRTCPRRLHFKRISRWFWGAASLRLTVVCASHLLFHTRCFFHLIFLHVSNSDLRFGSRATFLRWSCF